MCYGIWRKIAMSSCSFAFQPTRIQRMILVIFRLIAQELLSNSIQALSKEVTRRHHVEVLSYRRPLQTHTQHKRYRAQCTQYHHDPAKPCKCTTTPPALPLRDRTTQEHRPNADFTKTMSLASVLCRVTADVVEHTLSISRVSQILDAFR